MKINTLLSMLLFVVCLHTTIGQTPQRFTYQAVVRNSSGTITPNQAVSFRISILEESTTGATVYAETHFGATNQFGLINLEIGGGTPVTGDFSAISWGTNAYFLKIELDVTGGTNYELMGVSQLIAVPYAEFAGNGVQFDDGMTCDETTEGSIRYNYETKTLELCDGSSWVALGDGSSPGFHCGDVLIDTRDGQSYPTVQIGTQCWMAKNLNYGNYQESIFSNSFHSDVTNNGIPEKYALDNETANFEIYGGLYDWNELMNYNPVESSQGLCPDGWHIPSHDELIELINAVGGANTAGQALKIGGSSGFNFPLGGGRNAKGNFSAHTIGELWSSTVQVNNPTTRAWKIYFNESADNSAQSTDLMVTGKSCRCVKN